jgi:hypothetical protein
MANDTATSKSSGVVNMSTGSFTGDGTITAVTLGFVPRRVHLINVTDRIEQIWQEGMAATTTLNRDAAGAGTANTSSLIVPKGTGATDTYAGFQIAAAAAVSAKAYVWTAWG